MQPAPNPIPNPQSSRSKEGIALYYHPAYLEHDAGQHPESADRLRAILAALAQRGISQADLLKPQPVDPSLLAEVHDPNYIKTLEKAARNGGGYWDPDTYIAPGSYNAATLAAGAAVEAVDAVMSGARSAFALVRPPGHHALRDSAMGFCLLNNIAIAAHHAIRKHGLDRVMIVDWDVHHGNGTQDLFYNRPDALFFSTHQYPFYPGTGALDEMGVGKGQGYTVNVPLPAGVGDAGYIQVFNEALVPLARRYKPQLILISAGYDAHAADPLASMALTVAGFSELARIVRLLADELSEGRVAAVLEGGYNVEALAQSVLATIAMLGAKETALEEVEATEVPRPATNPHPTRRAPDITQLIQTVKQLHNL